MIQVNLGTALLSLGERESGTGKLTEAVADFRAALEEYKHERVPLQCAATQVNLGTALFRLGERLMILGERESGMGKLVEAVAAYRAALEEITPLSDPTNYQLTMKSLKQVLTLPNKKSGKKSSKPAVVVLAPHVYRPRRLQWSFRHRPVEK
jgi:tetratricopeptide (TPR) repeat protein